MSTRIAHEPDEQRYALHVDDKLGAVAEYRIQGNSISFTHTFTQPNMRGRGLAGQVVDFAIDDVESTTELRVIPMCWYVAQWFDAHPERKGLLER